MPFYWPFARRRPSRRTPSEGVRVQPRTHVSHAPHQPAGIPERAVSSQRRFHKTDARCVPRFLMEAASGGKGVRPLDPGCRRTMGLSEQRCAGKDVQRPAAVGIDERIHRPISAANSAFDTGVTC